jgi:hypothetical protein
MQNQATKYNYKKNSLTNSNEIKYAKVND